jgi:hypothetical protein
MKNLTLEQLKTANYKPLIELYPDSGHRKTRLNAILYIENMSGMLSIDIANTKMEYFMSEGELITDKKAINKLLLNLNTVAAQPERAITDAETLLLKNATERLKLQRKQLIENEQNKARRLLSSANEYYREFESKIQMSNKCYTDAQIMQGNVLDLVQEYKKMLAVPFWKYYGIEGNTIKFTTANDVVMGIHNPIMGLDFDVNMGKYMALFDMQNTRIRVITFENNLISRDLYYHTYISTSGEICWGNARETASNLLMRGEFAEVMKLLAANLSNYSVDSTPYRELQTFREVQTRKLSGNPDKPWCTAGECHNEDCEECSFCTFCNAWFHGRHCSQHFCGVCETYSNNPSDCCCPHCEHSRNDCTCCAICEGTSGECNCCHECDRSENYIEDHGHARGCVNARAEAPANDDPF